VRRTPTRPIVNVTDSRGLHSSTIRSVQEQLNQHSEEEEEDEDIDEDDDTFDVRTRSATSSTFTARKTPKQKTSTGASSSSSSVKKKKSVTSQKNSVVKMGGVEYAVRKGEWYMLFSVLFSVKRGVFHVN
jgi:Mg-chelatase subunit ChlI